MTMTNGVRVERTQSQSQSQSQSHWIDWDEVPAGCRHDTGAVWRGCHAATWRRDRFWLNGGYYARCSVPALSGQRYCRRHGGVPARPLYRHYRDTGPLTGLPERVARLLERMGITTLAQLAAVPDAQLRGRSRYFTALRLRILREIVPYQPVQVTCPRCNGAGMIRLGEGEGRL